MRNAPLILLLAVLAAAWAVSGQAHASSHRETPQTWQDPCTDHTDLYAWVTPGTHDKLYLIQVYNGLHEPGQGNYQTGFCDGVLYEFHIARGPDSLNPVITYQIEFSSTDPTPVTNIGPNTPVPSGGAELLVQLSGIQQTYTVRRVEVAANGRVTVRTLASDVPISPPNVGPRTDRLAYGLGSGFDIANPDDSTVSLFDGNFMKTFIRPLGTNEGRVWAGEADDPFYLDEDAIFDILNLRGPGAAKDVFAGFNAVAIALEIPTNLVTGTNNIAHNGTPGNDTTLGIWNTTSRRKTSIRQRGGRMTHIGPWEQVSRQGLPLVNAGLIGSQDQEKYLRTSPKDDAANFAPYFLNPVLVRDLDFLGTYAALGVPASVVATLKTNRTDILDVINLKDIPTPGAHSLATVGDVLRLDVAIDSGFPNGRAIPGGAAPNQEQVDVSDVIVTLVVAGAANVFDPAGLKIGDNVNTNDVNYLTEFPWVGVPHEGLAGGHGAVAP